MKYHVDVGSEKCSIAKSHNAEARTAIHISKKSCKEREGGKISKRKRENKALLHNKNKKTNNSGDSRLVTDVNTNPPVSSLSTGERTGSSVLWNLWSFVVYLRFEWHIIAHNCSLSKCS